MPKMKLDAWTILGYGLRAQMRAEAAEKKLKKARSELKTARSSFEVEIEKLKLELKAARSETTRTKTKVSGSSKEKQVLVELNESLQQQVKVLETKLRVQPTIIKKRVVAEPLKVLAQA